MGEYFNGTKLGTCTHLMYISREEMEELAGDGGEVRNRMSNNCDHNSLESWLRLKPGFLYRFPRHNEHARTLKQIEGREPFDYIRLEIHNEFEALHKDFSQIQITGNWLRVPETYNFKFCLLDRKHYDMAHPIKYGGWSKPPQEVAPTIIEIVGNRYTEEQPDGYTIFQCPCCEQRFSCDAEEIEKYIKPAMIGHGLKYEAEYVKPFTLLL